MIEAIHHVQITVPAAGLEAALHFCRDLLGLPLAPRPADLQRPGYWFRVFDRDLHLGVEENVDRPATRSHVAYKVSNLDEIRSRLTAAGIAMVTPVGMAGYARLHVRDPSGNLIELIQPTAINAEIDRKPQPKVHLSIALLHEGRVLMVQEAKPSMRGQWNLPGGHAERGEFAVPGALRELLEETGVAAEPTGILGLFSTNYSVRLVVLAQADHPQPIAGDEVMESRFWSVDDALALDDAAFVNPRMMRTLLGRIRDGVRYPLDLVESIGA